MALSIKLSRIDRIYRPGEKVSGAVVINSPERLTHQGISMTATAQVNLQLSARSVGLFEAFYSSLKPVQLMKYDINVSAGGRVPSGKTELPFAFVLKPFQGKRLFDTYHGVYVSVQYMISVEMQRGVLSKNLKVVHEFIVEVPKKRSEKEMLKLHQPYEFSISPTTLQNVRQGSHDKIPDFLFEGRLDSTVCNVTEPFRGELTVRRCAVNIKSIELQLVRVETCAYMEGEAREATEIQNIQIADGNVLRDLTIPIHMVFPRLFTCATTVSKEFKVEFEVNLIVLFADKHMVTENFPITLHR